jgi:hypothetical protein
MYLTHETGQPLTPVHVRLGHDRRWFLEYTTDTGRDVFKCMVNYKTKMVWDHGGRRLYDFEGRHYELEARVSEDSEDSDDDDTDDDFSDLPVIDDFP